MEALVKGIPQNYWYNEKSKQIFIEKAIFLKEKGLEIQEIQEMRYNHVRFYIQLTRSE